MDRNAYRDDNDTGQSDAYQPDAYSFDAYQSDGYQPDAYWRRRVITLCAGLALLGLPFLTASPSPGASLPGSSASARARAARGAAAAANAAAGPASGVEPGGGCAPNAIVLSLFASKSSYHAGQYPVFEVSAVSTASRGCTFNLSPAKLHVLVSSSGRVIWDSADCTRGRPTRWQNSAAASRPRSRSAGTPPSACPAASRWHRRRGLARTRCGPGTPAWPARSAPSNWPASRPRPASGPRNASGHGKPVRYGSAPRTAESA